MQPSRPGAPRTVLIVDDRDDLRRLLAMLLDDEPDFIVIAEGGNGREAIQLTRDLRPDLVVLDNDMPVMSGLEALPHVVAAGDSTVVMFSADADELRERALELGAAATVSKATGVLTFVDELRRVLTVKAGSAAPSRPSRT